jgi:hypothetical protein
MKLNLVDREFFLKNQSHGCGLEVLERTINEYAMGRTYI